jgi:vacuolar protein sorting-associated protein 41
LGSQAVQECERFRYDDELIYLYSKTGQMKRALYLIIDRLKDVRKAINFAKEQDDPDLWEDLLDYSMDKPSFIRGLLEQVGTSINPIKLVRRIPEGLEIPGLREGIRHIMKEHEIQYSISEGVARVLRSEVATYQADLRSGQRKGVKFDIAVPSKVEQVDGTAAPTPAAANGEAAPAKVNGDVEPPPEVKTGHCSKCHEPLDALEETLIGFPCGHAFHLSHLLELLYPDQPPSEEDAFTGGKDLEGSMGHLVGMKVTHARLLRDRLRGGCPLCKSRLTNGVRV